jgi:hypothetical protein
MSESYPSSITRLDSPTLTTFEFLPFSFPTSLMKPTSPGLQNTMSLLWQASRHGSVRDYIQNLTPSKAPPMMDLLDQVSLVQYYMYLMLNACSTSSRPVLMMLCDALLSAFCVISHNLLGSYRENSKRKMYNGICAIFQRPLETRTSIRDDVGIAMSRCDTCVSVRQISGFVFASTLNIARLRLL